MAQFDTTSLQQSEGLGLAAKIVGGFIGAIFAFKILPFLFRGVFKVLFSRFTFSIITEIVGIVLAGLLTEKAVEKLNE